MKYLVIKLAKKLGIKPSELPISSKSSNRDPIREKVVKVVEEKTKEKKFIKEKLKEVKMIRIEPRRTFCNVKRVEKKSDRKKIEKDLLVKGSIGRGVEVVDEDKKDPANETSRMLLGM